MPKVRVLGARVLGVAVGIALLAGAACTGASSTPSVSDRAKVHPSVLRAAEAQPSSLLSVIVREATPSSSAAERLVEGLGGTVTHDLSIIGGFSAEMPGGKLHSLLSSSHVVKVWRDGQISMSQVTEDDPPDDPTDRYDAASPNRVWQKAIRLADARPYNGSGVTVALLDTGVTPVPDLAGRIIASADFTSEGDGLDRYGHGTHMAGIIAGNGTSSGGTWTGVAPKANLVSVKVAGADGSTDVSVVIAGLQWIVAHRQTYRIRVLNLSFGTDSRQSYLADPLNYAVEQAWFSGIVVVTAAGNGGPGNATINKPADDPYVVSVGAANLNNTSDRTDDFVADFSSRGPAPHNVQKPDLLAPGISIVSNRVLGSTVDLNYPVAIVDDHYVKGTGTSQSAAVLSGVVALMYDARGMSPNVAKATVRGSSGGVTSSQPGGGKGLINAARAVRNAYEGTFADRPANQNLTPSKGLGSLELSRGSFHVRVDLDGDGVPDLLEGDTGFGWSEGSWAAGSWRAASWNAGSWRGSEWSAGSWRGLEWSAGSWRTGEWTASSWRSDVWSASSWSASSWRTDSWSASVWS